MFESVLAENHVVVLFIYGQVFFSLGLVIALQSWRHSRLALARTLKWLAAFGILHGLHEWADVFIPLQARYLSPPVIDLLFFFQLLLLSASFTCLFQFGIEMLRPLPGRWVFVRMVPAALLLLWFGLAIGPFVQISSDILEWRHLMSSTSRYAIGLPGALVAATGLLRQAGSLDDLRLPRATGKMLRMAAAALIGYALAAGLIVPRAPYFPANMLNQELVLRVTGFPIQFFRSLLGLMLTFTMFRVLEVFEVELDRQFLGMEEAQMLLSERERISRELHDGTLQSIYAAGMLLSVAEREVKRNNSAAGLGYIQQSVDLLNQSVGEIRGYIGDLRPQATELSLGGGLQELVESRHLRSLVDLDLDLPAEAEPMLPPAHVRHLLAIANEALSNVARHAQATQVHLRVTNDASDICLEIADNGRGLPVDCVLGYGLRNIHERASLLGGAVQVASRPGQGTTLKVRVPRMEVEPHGAPFAG